MGTGSSRTVSKARPEPITSASVGNIQPRRSPQFEQLVLSPPIKKPEPEIQIPDPESFISNSPKLKSPSSTEVFPEYASVEEVSQLEKEISEALKELPTKTIKQSIKWIPQETVPVVSDKRMDIEKLEQTLNEYNSFYHKAKYVADLVVQPSAQSTEVTSTSDKKESADWVVVQKPIKGFDPEKFKAANNRIRFSELSESASVLQSSCSLPATSSRKISIEERPKSQTEYGTHTLVDLPVYDDLDEALIATIEKDFD